MGLNRFGGWVGVSMISGLLASPSVFAAAKPVPSPGVCTPGNPGIMTPVPVRRVFLKPIGTKAFELPNGSGVDFNADLQSILNTAVTSTPVFTPVDAGHVDPCNARIEIRSAVTNFQLDVADVGLTFGYSPSGAIPLTPGLNIDAKVNVRIGTISMDFSIWQCIGDSCTAIAASTASQAVAGGNLTMEIDFNMIKTGPSLVFNTPLGDVMRNIMVNGMNQLATSLHLNELPWRAEVKEYIPAAGTVIFDEGLQSRLSPNQAFEIYAPTDSTSSGVCNVYEIVARIHTVSVNTVSSTALVDELLGSKGIHSGDIVMVRTVNLQ